MRFEKLLKVLALVDSSPTIALYIPLILLRLASRLPKRIHEIILTSINTIVENLTFLNSI